MIDSTLMEIVLLACCIVIVAFAYLVVYQAGVIKKAKLQVLISKNAHEQCIERAQHYEDKLVEASATIRDLKRELVSLNKHIDVNYLGGDDHE